VSARPYHPVLHAAMVRLNSGLIDFETSKYKNAAFAAAFLDDDVAAEDSTAPGAHWSPATVGRCTLNPNGSLESVLRAPEFSI
jgi:hypothetical protein